MAGGLCAFLSMTLMTDSWAEPPVWQQGSRSIVAQNDAYRPNDGYQPDNGYRPDGAYRSYDAYQPNGASRPQEPYRPSGSNNANGDAYRPGGNGGSYGGGYSEPPPPSGGYGEPYAPPRYTEPYDRNYGPRDGGPPSGADRSHYSKNEIVDTGHKFFGSISQGLGSVVEYAFQKAGRPNGYILGEDAGGAFVAGLRYGEGVLYTKDAGDHKVYWQGPSVGYDVGAEGSKTMVLVYNLRDPSEIYHRFGGVEGSAYFVGGVSVQFQQYGNVVLAPIRAGVGVRLGANVGYLKYTRRPTWNPF